MPRLHNFVTSNPHIDVRVSTRIRQFSRMPAGRRGDVVSVSEWVDEVDVAVVFGNGDYPGMHVDKLLSLSVTPLCSPDLLMGTPRLRKPTDLRHHTLVHDDRGMLYEGRSFWDMWLEKANVADVDTSQGPRFTHSVLAFEAATAKVGIVASTPALAAPYLATGRLVAPFALEVPLASGYYVVRNETAAKRAIVVTFIDWLLDQATCTGANSATG
jgi:LysR family glycine cleavage system transcriptional activator